MAKSYIAARSGFILGVWYEKGAKVPVGDKQAKYLTAPYGTDLQIAGAARPAQAKAGDKTEKAAKG